MTNVEWLEIYGDIFQKLAFVILAAYFLVYSKWFLDLLTRNNASEFKKQIVVSESLLVALGMLAAGLGYLRYGESDWAFLDLQVVFTVLAGLLGGVKIGALAGLLGSLFRLLIGSGRLTYFVVLITAGAIGGLCLKFRGEEKRVISRQTALLAGILAGLFHGAVIYQPMWKSAGFSVLSGIVFTLAVLEALSVYAFVAVALGRVSDERRKKLEKLLPEMKLKFLQAQINPHFLFNALNTIAAICSREKAEQARGLVIKLSNYFRRIAKREDEWVTLEEELDHIDSYLEIEKARYQNALQIKKDIRLGARGRKALLPILIIQPIVENAIKHGLMPRSGGGVLEISAWENGKMVEILVKDNGVGIRPDQLQGMLSESPQVTKGEGGGIGLRNINERLKYQFGKEHQLDIRSELGVGTTVGFKLPIESQKEE